MIIPYERFQNWALNEEIIVIWLKDEYLTV